MRTAKFAVINREMARQFWPAGDAVGQRIRMPGLTALTAWMLAADGSNGWLEVIGIAENTPNNGLREPAAAAVYVPFELVVGDAMNLTIRTQGAPMSLADALRRQVHAIDPGQPVNHISTAEDVLQSEGWGRERFVAMLFLSLGGLTTILGAIGLYSVISCSIGGRRRELGIRSALGAQRRDLLGLMLISVAKPVLAGVLAGSAMTLVSQRLLARWIAGQEFDAGLLLQTAAVQIAVSWAASWLPAWRASGVRSLPEG
jgi:hypothetical protein